MDGARLFIPLDEAARAALAAMFRGRHPTWKIANSMVESNQLHAGCTSESLLRVYCIFEAQTLRISKGPEQNVLITISRWCERIVSLAGPSPSSAQPTPTAKERRLTTWKPRPSHHIRPPDSDRHRASCSCLFVVQQRLVQPAYALEPAGGRLTGRCENIRQLFHRRVARPQRETHRWLVLAPSAHAIDGHSVPLCTGAGGGGRRQPEYHHPIPRRGQGSGAQMRARESERPVRPSRRSPTRGPQVEGGGSGEGVKHGGFWFP